MTQEVAAILKARSGEHLNGNYNVVDFGISDEEMERVFELSR